MTFPGTARVETVMGMPVSVDIRTALPRRELSPLLDDAFAWLRWVDETFSTYRPESQISRLNDGRTIEQIPEVVEVLHRCEELRGATGGWFDVSVSGKLDPSGYVKGWAVERLSRALTNAGAVDHRVIAGTDVRVRGSATPGRRWRIGVREPLRDAVCRVVFAHDLAVATTGGYVKGAKILSPHSGQEQNAPDSVTVIGPDLAVADAYATAMYAMGPVRARRFAKELAAAQPYNTMILGADGRAMSTPGFAEYGGAGDARLAG